MPAKIAWIATNWYASRRRSLIPGVSHPATCWQTMRDKIFHQQPAAESGAGAGARAARSDCCGRRKIISTSSEWVSAAHCRRLTASRPMYFTLFARIICTPLGATHLDAIICGDDCKKMARELYIYMHVPDGFLSASSRPRQLKFNQYRNAK